MGEQTTISWADNSWNPWIGCMKVSPACDGCYAEAMMDKRLGRVGGARGAAILQLVTTGAAEAAR